MLVSTMRIIFSLSFFENLPSSTKK
ncbi:unnamed protein product [Spirodela intermedia]|uniref:Uncharacterized protein n=1 Tax=Spirodela intermedia TaxID=51605 RepID=A0A7I8IPX9_SPIIN|nr:unnamed protein product [Spirodela intermedia]CAA6659624.1 unnamed protein product [Spirodela intermedia]